MKLRLKRILSLVPVLAISALTAIACAQVQADNTNFITLAIKDDLDIAKSNSTKALVPLVASYNAAIQTQNSEIQELQKNLETLKTSLNPDATKISKTQKKLQDLQTIQANTLPVKLIQVGTNFGNLYELTNKSLAASKVGPYNITLSYPSTASLIASYGRQLNLKSDNALFNVSLEKYGDNFVKINERIFGADPHGHWFVPFQGTSEHLLFNRFILNEIIHQAVTKGGASFETKADKQFFLKHFTINPDAYNSLDNLSTFPANFLDATEISKLYPALTATKSADVFENYKFKANVFEQYPTFFDLLTRIRKAWPHDQTLRPYLLGENSVANTFFMNAFAKSGYDYSKFLFYNDPKMSASLNYQTMFKTGSTQNTVLKNTFNDFLKLINNKALYLRSNSKMAYSGTNYWNRQQPFSLSSTTDYPFLVAKERDVAVVKTQEFQPQYWVYKKPDGAKTDLQVFLKNPQTQKFHSLWKSSSSETSDFKLKDGTNDTNFTNNIKDIANQPIGAFVNADLKTKIVAADSSLSSKFTEIEFNNQKYYFFKNTDFTYKTNLAAKKFKPQELATVPGPSKNLATDSKSTFMWQGPGLIGVASPNQKNNNATRLFLKWFTTQTGTFNLATDFDKTSGVATKNQTFTNQLPSEVYGSIVNAISTTKTNLSQSSLNNTNKLSEQAFNNFKASSTSGSNVIAFSDPADKQAARFRNAIDTTFGLLISQTTSVNYDLFIQQLKKAGF